MMTLSLNSLIRFTFSARALQLKNEQLNNWRTIEERTAIKELNKVYFINPATHIGVNWISKD